MTLIKLHHVDFSNFKHIWLLRLKRAICTLHFNLIKNHLWVLRIRLLDSCKDGVRHGFEGPYNIGVALLILLMNLHHLFSVDDKQSLLIRNGDYRSLLIYDG